MTRVLLDGKREGPGGVRIGPGPKAGDPDPGAPPPGRGGSDGRPSAGLGGDDTMSGPGNRDAGMTLVELLISLMVLGLVAGAALNFFRAEQRAYFEGAERMEVLQNLRYAVNALEKDLRVAGANTVSGQPHLVYAGTTSVAFNADFSTNDPADAYAVYYEPDAPDEAVTALRASRQITIPGSSFRYPDVDYEEEGANSPAETITFFFRADETTDREDDFALYRQINDLDPELIARHLVRSEDRPFLSYRRVVDPEDGPPRIEPVPTSELPLAHEPDVHGSGGDDAAIDSLRAVSVDLAARPDAGGLTETEGTVSRLVRLPNMGVKRVKTCGSEPIFGRDLTLTPVELPSGDSAVNLSWEAAVDETEGEEDVIRYVVWRRTTSESEWTEPAFSIPSGNDRYTFDDDGPEYGVEYEYAIAAQDCTPTLSGLTTAGPIELP